MLVLSRKPKQTICIGENIRVTVVRCGPNSVKLGIDAPRDLNIWREELAPRDEPPADPAREITAA